MTAYSLVIIAGAILAVYLIRFSVYGFTIVRTRLPRGNEEDAIQLDVTLLLPFRNEADTIAALIQDILAQQYPTEKTDVIFINDHSEDASVGIIKQACQEVRNFRLLHLPDNLEGKKEAINLGVREARSQLIIQTDADCRLPAGFIQEHVKAARVGKESFISGPVRYEKSERTWDKLEALEFMSLVGTGMASFLRKKPVMCNGANISYSRSFYLRNEEELKKITSPSGDDMFLMIRAKKERVRMKFLLSKDAIVETSATGSLSAFLQQRIRWGSKARFYPDFQIVYLGILSFLANASVLALLITSLIDRQFLIYFGSALALKSIADLFLLGSTAKHLDRMKLLLYFPLAAIFYYFYLVLAGVFSLFMGYRWKGRIIKFSAH